MSTALAAMPPSTVLLIDDDAELAELLVRLFSRECLDLMHAPSVAAGLALYQSRPPAAVILDLMLPDGHGLDLCRQLRSAAPLLPILILTARGDPIDRVLGLELGADDYLGKPFDARELLARTRALLRRQHAAQDAAAPTTPPIGSRIERGTLVLDTLRLVGTLANQPLPLTGNEFRLLVALAREPGEALDRERLAAAVQAGNYRPLQRAVDVQIGRLRRKLRNAGADCIRTIRGSGYALIPPTASDDGP
jgi:DNA-binding response OmpR family regulator